MTLIKWIGDTGEAIFASIVWIGVYTAIVWIPLVIFGFGVLFGMLRP